MTLLLLFSRPVSSSVNIRVTATNPTGPLEPGDMVSRTIEFRDTSGELVDPGEVTASVRNPYGTTTTEIPVRMDTGTYQLDVLADMDGTWSYRLVSETPYAGAIERRFTVQPTAF